MTRLTHAEFTAAKSADWFDSFMWGRDVQY